MFSVFFKKLFLLRAFKPLISKQNPLAFDAAILVTPKRSQKTFSLRGVEVILVTPKRSLKTFSLRGVETINFKVKPSGLRCSNTSTFIQSSRVSLETSRSLFWCLIGCNIGVRVKSDYFLIRYCFLKINVLNVTKTRCLRVYLFRVNEVDELGKITPSASF